MVSTMQLAGSSLESAGAGILMRQPLGTIGGHLVECGNQFQIIATCIQQLSPSSNNGQVSSQRMAYAAEQMILAGQELQPKNNEETKSKSKGKGWLKG